MTENELRKFWNEYKSTCKKILQDAELIRKDW